MWREEGGIPMNRRLQPGDIAISVNTDLPENIGVIVEVLAVNVADPTWGTHHGPICLVRSAGSRPIHINHWNGVRWLRSIVREATAPESRFRPITPPAGEHEEHKQVELLTQ